MARTTHRSKRGKKLYGKRSESGKFKDIQRYKRAHGSDIKRRSKAERKKKNRSKTIDRAGEVERVKPPANDVTPTCGCDFEGEAARLACDGSNKGDAVRTGFIARHTGKGA